MPERFNAPLYRSRRQSLMAELESDSVIILIGNPELVRSRDIHYPFRQDHDFYYLTGYAEPDAVAVLRPDSDAPFVLFNRPRDPHQETWFASRAGQQGAKEIYGADIAYDIAELEYRLPELIGMRIHIYLADERGLYSHRLTQWLGRQRHSVKFDQPKVYPHLHSILPYIHARRVFKDDTELGLLRQAIDASVAGHKRLMKLTRPGVTEVELNGEFMASIGHFGCKDVGYPNIIASGNNACCLHYDTYLDTLRDGQLLLVDAGADYQYYCGDITRTCPVNGKFSGAQRDLYQLVLNSLDSAIELVRPGCYWNTLYEKAMAVLAQGLLDLGILQGSFEQVMEQELYKPYSLAKTGHWLGMDVHDVGPYRENDQSWRKLCENMVFTIEPGLYFPQDCEHVDPKWRGMGIRIEDDILVTQGGHENLSADAPRTVRDIEDYMAS